MPRYTLHINLDATDDADALEQGRHIVEDLIRRPVGSWDVSGEDANGMRDWSNIIKRDATSVRHNAFHQELHPDAESFAGDHFASDCEDIDFPAPESMERTIESDLAEGR